jgi:hypothetical protein
MLQLSYPVQLAIGLVGVILFFTTYTYIEKLEKLGCPCAESPYRSFIKNFCIAAIIYLVVFMVMPANTLVKTFGKIGGLIVVIVSIIFTILFIIFYIVAFIYTSGLIREKCKCSEDVRREALYYWSIIEIILFATVLILPLFVSVVGAGIAIVSSSVNYVHDSAHMARTLVTNPVHSVGKIPSALKASAKAASKLMRKRR